PSAAVRIVGRLLRMAAREPASYGPLVRGRDLLADEPPGFHPLLLPTAAVGLAVLAAPPALVGGALAAASLPIVARAVDGIRHRRFNVDQLDLSALIILTAM